jgi:hypothetical protein
MRSNRAHRNPTRASLGTVSLSTSSLLVLTSIAKLESPVTLPPGRARLATNCLTTEVVLGPDDGLPRTSAVRCDFLTLMFKRKLTHFVSTLSAFKLAQLNRALAHALELPSR